MTSSCCYFVCFFFFDAIPSETRILEKRERETEREREGKRSELNYLVSFVALIDTFYEYKAYYRYNQRLQEALGVGDIDTIQVDGEVCRYENQAICARKFFQKFSEVVQCT